MRVDDITFCHFVNNDLPQAKMIEIEKTLIEDGEINASIQASILNYSINKDYADDLLGIDEKNISTKDRISLYNDSKEANNKSLILKSTTMNNKLSKEEILKVQDLVVKFNESYNAELSLEENLVQFYLTQRPGAFIDDARDITNGLKSGIISFNTNLKKALEDGDFDYTTELREIASEMSINEKYELYINFLAALQTLSVNNLTSEQASELNDFKTIRERLIINEDVTEDMLHDVESKIGELLNNNNLCLGSIEKLKELIKELPNGTEAIESIVTDSEQDMREKMITSMTTYIAYQNEELESLKGQELSPEVIAISVAAGIEEMRVMNNLNSGQTTVDVAIKILKFIGGIALFSLLAYISINFVSAIGILSIAMFMVAWGSTTIATIAALLASSFVILSLAHSTAEVGEKIMNWSSRIFDIVVETWRKSVWPRISTVLNSIGEWFMSLFQRKAIAEAQQSNENAQSLSSI